MSIKSQNMPTTAVKIGTHFLTQTETKCCRTIAIRKISVCINSFLCFSFPPFLSSNFCRAFLHNYSHETHSQNSKKTAQHHSKKNKKRTIQHQPRTNSSKLPFIISPFPIKSPFLIPPIRAYRKVDGKLGSRMALFLPLLSSAGCLGHSLFFLN
jgi:hypothetical protein